jgi:heptosyltransferase-1
MERLLIVRLGAMGDVIHALPMAATLRAAFRGAKIGWLVEEPWVELLCGSEEARIGPRSAEKPVVDVIHAVNTKAWRSAPFSDETWREFRAAIRELREAGYEAAIDVQGAMKSAVLARLSGAPVRLGFATPRERIAKMFYSRVAETAGTHVIEQNVCLARHLSNSSQAQYRFDLPRSASAEAWAEQELRQRGVARFALLTPGAGWEAKRWPAERYGETAQRLRDLGLTSLMNFAPGEEEIASTAVRASGGEAQGLKCSVGELIALTRRAALFIGGDTGPMHLAAALQVPVIAIFGPTDPVRNGPFGTPSKVLRSSASITSYSHRQRTDPGLPAITVDEVIAAARELLREVSGETRHA